jgi:Zn-dependent M16 (insulinase) family peptidase
MIREFSALTDELRSCFREHVLDVGAGQLQDAAANYFAKAGKSAVVAVFAPEERLKQANGVLADKLILEKLP